MKAIVYAVALTFATSSLTGCQTTNAYTGEEETSNATWGAGIGALAGAAIGALANKDNRAKGALIGAGIGGVAGGGVGHYMDTQEAELREKLQGTGVSVTRQGDNLILNMPGNITFGSNSTALNADFFKVLDSVVIVLQEYKSTLINVEGHTDSTGKEEYNQKLSQQRASTVAQYLNGQEVAVERIAVIGYGETKPIADNQTEAGRATNRRVEIILQPIVKD